MDWEILGIYLIIIVLFAIVTSIKEKENVFRLLADFFIEWFEKLKIIVPPLIIIVVLLLAWFG